MAWKRAHFKGQKVWADVGPDGALAEQGGRVAIRYQPRAGARIYRAAAGRLSVVDGAAPEALPDGAPPDEPSASTASSSPKRRAATGGSAGSSPRGRPGGFGKAGTRTAAQAALAVEAASALVAQLEGRAVIAFTDGACKGNPGPAGCGAVVCLPSGRRGEASQALGRATNNVAELTAIGLALDLMDAAGVGPEAPGAILTDSAYAHGVLARGWKAKANQALIEELRGRLAQRPALALHWIAGHVGVEGNERADALANLGVEGVTGERWER